MGAVVDLDILGLDAQLGVLRHVIGVRDPGEFLDLALVYALINFIGTIAVTKYVGFQKLDPEVDRHDGDI